MRFISFLLFLAFAFITITPSHAQEPVLRKDLLRIVTTTGHIADMVREIVGDKAQVQAMMGTGSDPHLFRPTRSDLFLLKQADIIFYNGLHLEAQMTNVLKMMQKDKPVIAIADVIETRDLISEEGHSFDPHIWMNVNNWRHAVTPVVEAIAPYMDAEGMVELEKSAEAYRTKLDKLDYQIQVTLKTIPQSKRVLITAHDAFGYLGRAYGIQVIGIQGLSTESEASIQHIENLIDLITEHDIQAIFAETSVDSRNVEAILEGVAAKGHSVINGGELYSDSLGPEGSFGDNYIGMMVHNVSIIAKALGGHDESLQEYKDTYRRYQ